MAIVGSVFIKDNPQADGRFWVHETHTDHRGLHYIYDWLADNGIDPTPIMNGRVPSINALLTENEITDNITTVVKLGSLAALTLNYSTFAQNGAAARLFYRTATQTQVIMMADFLATLTDVQLQNTFGLNAAQVTNLRTTKLTPAIAQAAAIRAATGA